MKQPDLKLRPAHDRLYRIKLYTFRFALLVCFGYLEYQLFKLQIIDQKKYQRLALNSKRQIIRTAAYRGEIYADDGKLKIVENIPSFSIFLIPYNFPHDTEVRNPLIKKISSDFDISTNILISILKKGRWYPYKPHLLIKDASKKQIAILAEHIDDYPGLLYQSTPKRHYVFKETYGHITGYINKISPSLLQRKYHLGYHKNSLIGVKGVEAYYDLALRGSDGYQYQIINARRQIIGQTTPDDAFAVPGNDIVLTINHQIQTTIEKMMNGVVGGCVVTKVSTGEVLGIYSYPSYDPNIFVGHFNRKKFEKYSQNPNLPFFNRPVQGEYPASSVFKIIMASAALGEGEASFYAPVFECHGSMQIGPQYFKCEGYHGRQNLYQAIVNSCNVYFYNIGMKLGNESIKRWAYRYFKLGQSSGIDLPYEKYGRVPDHRWKLERRGVFWWDGDTANLSIGQGFLLVNLLQINAATAAIANEGIAYKPHLLKKRIDVVSGNPVFEYEKKVHIDIPLDKKSINYIQRAMRSVMVWGTARYAGLSPVKIAGKTGTAQNVQGKAHGWFTCYAPYNGPKEKQIAVTVFAEHGGHGGSAAAPIAVSIVESILKGINPYTTYRRIMQPWESHEADYKTWLKRHGLNELDESWLEDIRERLEKLR